MSTAEGEDLSEDERRGLELVHDRGAMYQSEFW
jgi:hypothetical protein